jgi:NDP-sugar pyrophosphorylase family protein
MIVSSDFTAFCENSLRQGATTAVSVLNDMIEQGHQIQSSPVSETWFDVDTIEDILHANRFLLDSIEEQYPGSILIPKGDTMDIGDTIILDSGIELGQGVRLIGPCIIRENSKIGKNCHIGPNVSLDLGTEVGSDCEIQNAVIYGRSKISPRSKVHEIIMYESTQFRMEE